VREEIRPSFVPQFLQNRASAGLAVLQLSQILDPCTGPVRGVSSGHGRTGFSFRVDLEVFEVLLVAVQSGLSTNGFC